MNDPVFMARWVLETKGVTGTPAEHLQDIAHQENIRVKYACLPNDPELGGQLLYKGEKKALSSTRLLIIKADTISPLLMSWGIIFLNIPQAIH